MSKIKYGIRKVYYAVATETTTDNVTTVTYGTPVALPGAVSISLEQQGDLPKFYADDIVYWQTSVNNGYEGDLELAKIPDTFKTDILGMRTDNGGMIVESSDDVGKSFALLFEFQGDDKATRHVLYNCTATRPAVASSTKEDTIEPQTETVTISAIANVDGYVKASALDGTANYATWYTAVKTPTFTP